MTYTFRAQFSDYREHDGEPLSSVAFQDPENPDGSERYTYADVGPMFTGTFPDGTAGTFWPEEIEPEPPHPLAWVEDGGFWTRFPEEHSIRP